MTEFDERELIGRLHALTRAVDVTERDLAPARARLADRLEERPSRRRLKMATVAAAAVAAVAAVAFAIVAIPHHDASPPPQPARPILDPDAIKLPLDDFLAGTAPTTGDLVGLWRLRSSEEERVMMLGSDGHGAVVDGTNLIDGSLANRVTYSVAGGVLTLKTTGGPCETGWTVRSRGSLMSDGSLHLVTQSDSAPTTAGDSCRAAERYVWDAIAPGPSTFLQQAEKPTENWDTPAYVWALLEPGLYVTRDGTWVLDVASDRSYRLFRGGDRTRPVDAGRILEDDQRGVLTLSCRGGTLQAAQVQTSRSEAVPGVSTWLRWYTGTITRSDCASGLASGPFEWLMMMPQSTVWR